MKKGIIIEMKGNQNVILADNGRFYIVAAKEGGSIGEHVKVSSAKKRIISLILVVVVTASVMYSGIFVFTTANSNVAESLVQVEVNPCAEFLLNKNDKVLSVAPLNEAAAMLITGEKFQGMSIDEAIKHFIELVILCGYINVENNDNAIYIHNLNENEGKTNSINAKINNMLESYLSANSYKAVILNDITTPAVSALATMNNCSISRFKISYTIYKIFKNSGDEREFEQIMAELNTKSVKELLNVIRQAHIYYNQKLSEEKKAFYHEQKTLKTELYQENINIYKNNPENVVNYELWAENKIQLIDLLSKNYEINFSTPQYITEFA